MTDKPIKINPLEVLKVLTPKTEIKLCQCGNNYYGLPNICPDCSNKYEKLIQSRENENKKKTLLRSSIFEKLKLEE